MKAFLEGPPIQTSIYDRHPGLREAVTRGYPDTVLLIPDGNATWARSHGISVSEGHAAGAQALLKFLPAFVELPSKTFIPWAFSYDNWTRPKDERDGIMQTIEQGLQTTEDFFHENKIRFIRIGREDRIQQFYPSLWDRLCNMGEITRNYESKRVVLPIDFSGTDQHVRMMERFKLLITSGGISPSFQITPAFVESLRDGEGLVKPADVIIRTSGQYRTSDLGWLNTNSEIFFISKNLPDCDENDIVKVYIDYPYRERRYGGRQTPSSPTFSSRV